MMEDLTVISGSGERFELRLPGPEQLEQTIGFIREALELPSGECRQKIAGALRGFFPQHYSSSLEKISHPDVLRLISAFALLLQNRRAEAFFSRTDPFEKSVTEKNTGPHPFDHTLPGENILQHPCSHSGEIRKDIPASALDFPEASDLLPDFPGGLPEERQSGDNLKEIPPKEEKHTDVFQSSAPSFAEHPPLFTDISDMQETHTENPPIVTKKADTLKKMPQTKEKHTDVFQSPAPSFAEHPPLFPDMDLEEAPPADTPLAHSEVPGEHPGNSLTFSFLPRFPRRIDEPAISIDGIFSLAKNMGKSSPKDLSENFFLPASAVSDAPELSAVLAGVSLFSAETPLQEISSAFAIPEIFVGGKTFSTGEMQKLSGTGTSFLPKPSSEKKIFEKYIFSPAVPQKAKGTCLTVFPESSGEIRQQELQFSDRGADDFSFSGAGQKEFRYGDGISAPLISMAVRIPTEELSLAAPFSFSGNAETSLPDICDRKSKENTASAEALSRQQIIGASFPGYDDAGKTMASSGGRLKYIEKAPPPVKTDEEVKRFEMGQKPPEKTLAQRENVLTGGMGNRETAKEFPEENTGTLTAGDASALSGKSFSLQDILPWGKDDSRVPGIETAFSGSTAGTEYAVFSEQELFQNCEKAKAGVLSPSYDLSPVPTAECETLLLIGKSKQTTHKETQDLNICNSLAPAAETCGETLSAAELAENPQFFSAEKQKGQHTAAEAETSDFQQSGRSREPDTNGHSGKISLKPDQNSIRLRQESKIIPWDIDIRKSPETESFSVGLRSIAADTGTGLRLTLPDQQTKTFCRQHQELVSTVHSEDQLFSFSDSNAANSPENRITAVKIDGGRDNGLRNGRSKRTKQIFTEKADKHQENTVSGQPLPLFEEQKQEFPFQAHSQPPVQYGSDGTSQAHSQTSVPHGHDVPSASVEQKNLSQESPFLSDRKIDLRQKVLTEEQQTFDDRESSYSDEVIYAAFCYKWQLEYAASLPRELLKRCLAIAGVRFRERKEPSEQENFSADDVARAISRGKAALEKLKKKETSSL